MKKLEHVKKFQKDSPVLSQLWEEYYNHSKNNEGYKCFSYESQKSLRAKEEGLNKAYAEELEKRSGRKLASFDNPAQFASMPDVIAFANMINDNLIDMVLPETLWGSMGVFADIRIGGWTDSFEFNIENNSLFQVSRAGRRQKVTPAQKMENSTATLAPINHQVTVTVNTAEILAGRQYLGKFLIKVMKSIESQMLYECYDALNELVDNSIIPTQLIETNYTEKGAIKLAETVMAWNSGKRPLFIGTAIALKSLFPDGTGARYMLDDEYVKLGHLRTFNDFDTLQMTQIADYTSKEYALKLKDDRIFVVSPDSDKILKLAVGDTMSRQTGAFDASDLSQKATILKPWEVGAITNSEIGVIEL